MISNAHTMKFPPIEQITGQMLTLTIAYFTPAQELVLAVLFMWFIDWVLGVWKSLKAKRRLTSYRFRKSISKITTYIMCILSTFVMEKTFLPNWVPLTSVAAGYIAWVELVSIYENTSEITGKAFIKDLIALLKRNFDNYFKPQ